jgi:hypothetical protein
METFVKSFQNNSQAITILFLKWLSNKKNSEEFILKEHVGLKRIVALWI